MDKINSNTSEIVFRKKLGKAFFVGCLAVFMAVITILGGCTPTQTNTNVAQSGGLTGVQSEANLLGLDPKNDPVVYTTESGLEIRMSNANKFAGAVTTTTNTGSKFSQDLSSFYYFTMGKYSGTFYTGKTQTDTYTVTNEPVNWLIIGRGEMPVADSSPAGSAIQGDAGKQEIAMGSSIYESINLSAIPENSDIPKGCMLVLSEKMLGRMYFNSTGNLNSGLYQGVAECNIIWGSGHYGNRYRFYGDINTGTTGAQSWTISGNKGGDLYNYINKLFSKNNSTGAIVEGCNGLGFTQAQANLVVPQQLYTYYSNGTGYNYQETPQTDGGTYYTMFPLAYRAAYSSTYQNFCIEDYFSTNANRVASFIGTAQSDWYWLRSGNQTYTFNIHTVRFDGTCSMNNPHNSLGVRPAMVMKLA